MDPPSHGTVTQHQVPADTDDFDPAVAAALAARAQAVVYCGDSSRRAASCAGALRAAGLTGTLAATQAALTPEFLRAVGAAAEGWVFSATFMDPARLTPAAVFRTVVQEAVRRPERRLGRGRGLRHPRSRRARPPRRGTGPCGPGQPHPTAAGSVVPGHHLDARLPIAYWEGGGGTGLFLWRVEQGAPLFLGQYQEARV
ncbi:ABC transporter substrate-binding protein [Streptomyces olivaceoviridis]|uniref:ABC transporter substrate-binding protein n=1 Tax=Streptomyces olivaceoviridis TaxID=1921 RepID=UPI003794E251